MELRVLTAIDGRNCEKLSQAPAPYHALPHTRVHELLPWNWKAARYQTLAT